jgi:hypothetical protein
LIIIIKAQLSLKYVYNKLWSKHRKLFISICSLRKNLTHDPYLLEIVELFDNYSKFYFFRSIWDKHLLPGESFYLFKYAFIQINQISKNTFKWSKEIATHGKVSLLIAKKMLSMMKIVSIGTKAEKTGCGYKHYIKLSGSFSTRNSRAI